MSEIRVGTSGFSFADWVGPVYPTGVARNRMLEYYECALGFDSVELNFTYYTMPVPATLAAMVARTSPEFRFVVRSHKEMTHDIWTDESRSEQKDQSLAFARFRAGIEPLVRAGRLGCVLVQLPTFFRPGAATRDYLSRLSGLLPGVRLVVEFRNRAWLGPETYQLLAESGLGYCVVDEPRLGPLLPFDPRRTAPTAYFRLHGRNRAWFTAGRSERYNYLYSSAELAEFSGPVRSVAAGAEQTFVFFNNCHAGAAARNALMMKQMLGLVGSLVPAQARVVEGTDGAGQQLDLN
jgi:uncharacterized protein YecE (DUF72 family)